MSRAALLALLALLVGACDVEAPLARAAAPDALAVARVEYHHLAPAAFRAVERPTVYPLGCSRLDVTLSIDLPDLSSNCVVYASLSHVPRGSRIVEVSALYDRDGSHLGTPGGFRVELYRSGLYGVDPDPTYQNGAVPPTGGDPTTDASSVGLARMRMTYDHEVTADVWPSIYVEGHRGAHLVGVTVAHVPPGGGP